MTHSVIGMLGFSLESRLDRARRKQGVWWGTLWGSSLRGSDSLDRGRHGNCEKGPVWTEHWTLVSVYWKVREGRKPPAA